MVVIIKTKQNEPKKAFLRNQVFQEVDQNNKKIGSITTSTIKSVFWPTKAGMEEVPIKDWLKLMEETNYLGLN